MKKFLFALMLGASLLVAGCSSDDATNEGIYGTYYGLLDKDGNIKKMNLVTGGTMSLTIEGNMYSIVCDFTDINGTKIKATYNGVVEYTDNTQRSAALSLGEPHSALRSFSTAAQLSERCTIVANMR